MKEYKSVQELIIRAALYDQVTTTIGPNNVLDVPGILKITFLKDNVRSCCTIDAIHGLRDPEELILHNCKRALCKLLMAPYDEIEITKEN